MHALQNTSILTTSVAPPVAVDQRWGHTLAWLGPRGAARMLLDVLPLSCDPPTMPSDLLLRRESRPLQATLAGSGSWDQPAPGGSLGAQTSRSCASSERACSTSGTISLSSWMAMASEIAEAASDILPAPRRTSPSVISIRGLGVELGPSQSRDHVASMLLRLAELTSVSQHDRLCAVGPVKTSFTLVRDSHSGEPGWKPGAAGTCPSAFGIGCDPQRRRSHTRRLPSANPIERRSVTRHSTAGRGPHPRVAGPGSAS